MEANPGGEGFRLQSCVPAHSMSRKSPRRLAKRQTLVSDSGVGPEFPEGGDGAGSELHFK